LDLRIQPTSLSAPGDTRALQDGRRHSSLAPCRVADPLALRVVAQGRRGDARNVLEPLYDWFTEGDSTKDLIAAREVLEQL
jgi:hypothetical protein